MCLRDGFLFLLNGNSPGFSSVTVKSVPTVAVWARWTKWTTSWRPSSIRRRIRLSIFASEFILTAATYASHSFMPFIVIEIHFNGIFCVLEVQYLHDFRTNETLESELRDLQIGYTSLLQSCYKYKLDGALEGDRYAEFPIKDKVNLIYA